MTKKFSLLTLLFLVACVGFVLAQGQQQYPPGQQQPEQQQMPAQEQQQSPMGQAKDLTGVVQKIDMEKKMITIKEELTNKSHECKFSDATTFSKAGQSSTVSALKKGDRVSLQVDAQDNATRVSIESAESTSPPKQNQ